MLALNNYGIRGVAYTLINYTWNKLQLEWGFTICTMHQGGYILNIKPYIFQ